MDKIRKASGGDARAISILQLQSSQSAYKGILPVREITPSAIADREKIWTAFIQEDKTDLFVHEGPKAINGYVHFGPTRDEDRNPGDVAEIFSIYVHPDSWRNGIGWRMAQFALNEVRQRHGKAMTLWVLHDNTPAVCFYKKLGFETDGTVKEHSSHLVEVRMKLDL